ncbi:Oidioi.mRNA.OKI2018_I69.PAR.g12393.t1.cds [Oikopleura dioica]|uniref:Oidioi.mRNA.OKI2018_I69.PAR.g12393.t1.cds n=1 Tax=Oikopleura dioica TaxID=34765 RepID=A0ABN7S351_OIKDI|nr:Oidioi.mRNA.OKI2018_I69.PAR.g12393.t1.cds [Oikopleura dioica]
MISRIARPAARMASQQTKKELTLTKPMKIALGTTLALLAVEYNFLVGNLTPGCNSMAFVPRNCIKGNY